MKLLFLVNGSAQSAAAHRALAFAERLPTDWIIRIEYRPARKWVGLLRFVLSSLRFRPRVTYVMDIGYAGVLAGCMVKWLLGCRLLIDTGDVVYELARSLGTRSMVQLALIRWVERMAVKNADALIVRGSYHKSWLEQRGIHHATFVPDGVDLKTVRPQDSSNLRADLHLEGHLVIGMLGTMVWSEKHQMCYGWELIEALALLKDAPVRALLIGDGSGRDRLQSRAEQLGVLNRVTFTGFVPIEELPRFLSVTDVCTTTQSNDTVGWVRTTGKLPLYLACGKYIIATDVGEASRVLPGVGCLLPYQGIKDPDYPSRLAQHIRDLLAEPNRLHAQMAARQVAKDNFDYDLLARRVEALCVRIGVAARPADHTCNH